MTENIIFDLGCVLVSLDDKCCMDAFAAIGCGEVVPYIANHRTEDIFFDVELGRISTRQFCDEVRRMCRTQCPDDDIVWAWNQLLTGISDEKKRLLTQLAGGHRLFLLSNTNDMHWQKCRTDFFSYHGSDASRLFERIYLSYDMHLAKPDPRIYEAVLADAGIRAADTLFIDDGLANVEAAARLGIATLHETTGHDWTTRIQQLL